MEATAPSCLDLLGVPSGGVQSAAEAPPRVGVAVDRRVHCRVEWAPGGVEIHAKDTLQRVEAAEVGALPPQRGSLARAASALAAAGVTSGVKVATLVRVPEHAGLATGPALSLALAAALLGDAGPGEASARAAAVEEALGGDPCLLELQAARLGGAHVLLASRGAGEVAVLDVDPARLEECLMLVDAGAAGDLAAPVRDGTGGSGGEVVAALRAGAYEAVAAPLAAFHQGRLDAAPAPLRQLGDEVARAGGVAWPCGRLLAVWAVPGARADGPRERVAAALRAAGTRPFAVRVDLRGLEVE